MIFNALRDISNKYPNKLAVNSLTYKEFLEEIDNEPYQLMCEDTDYKVLVKLFKASKLNKPIVVLPKNNRNNIEIPDKLSDQFQLVMYSSGSSGVRKPLILPETMLFANAQNAVTAQNMFKDDKILTVCSLNHTGGLNAQTVAGLLIGAHVIVEPFNAFNFYRLINEHNITLTHLIPPMIDLLIKVDSNVETPTLKWVTCGSDCVYKHHVKYFLDKNIIFMTNYGMTESGPIIINKTYYPNDDLSINDNGVVLGDRHFVSYKIIDNELYLKGSAINTNDWLATGDCVREDKGVLYYLGRKSHGCKIIPKQY